MAKEQKIDRDVKGEFMEVLRKSLKENTFVKFTLGKYRGSEDGLENIYVNPVKIKEEVKFALRYKYKTRDIYKNHTADEAANIISDEMGKNFLYGGLFTTVNDHVLEYNKKRVPRTYTRKASFSRVEIKEHNRIKTRYIDSKDKYLNLLGITNQKGEVKGDKYDKFRQVDKFIEILNGLIESSSLADKNEVDVIDFGSGKSYLTFAVYNFLNHKLGLKTKVTGIEQREDLAQLSNDISTAVDFNDLKFINNTINDNKIKEADIVIALHACDTATDDAIAKAIALKAEIVILAPCCQKYVRKHLHIPEELKGVFKHGILEEHLASFITDGLRALVLESYGYKTKVFEFISGDHTSKNIMITAILDEFTDDNYFAKVVEIEKMKSQFGLSDFYLDKLLTKIK
ncbi:MAG: SAM-dependent methyltransferase [Ignavibacteria bacterium]|nr:SAM-dependent methyltransferase [Ignavibacteria bacterium]